MQCAARRQRCTGDGKQGSRSRRGTGPAPRGGEDARGGSGEGLAHSIRAVRVPPLVYVHVRTVAVQYGTRTGVGRDRERAARRDLHLDLSSVYSLDPPNDWFVRWSTPRAERCLPIQRVRVPLVCNSLCPRARRNRKSPRDVYELDRGSRPPEKTRTSPHRSIRRHLQLQAHTHTAVPSPAAQDATLTHCRGDDTAHPRREDLCGHADIHSHGHNDTRQTTHTLLFPPPCLSPPPYLFAVSAPAEGPPQLRSPRHRPRPPV